MNSKLESLTFRRKALQKLLADLDWELENEPVGSLIGLYDRAIAVIRESSLSEIEKRSEFSKINKLRLKHESRKEDYSAMELRSEVVRIRAELDQLSQEIYTFYPCSSRK